jgi:ribosome-associated protein
MMANALEVTDTIAIPRSELSYRATRSGGAGGQHVNTSSTRIELLWPFEQSVAIDDRQKELIRKRLSKRIDGDGQLRVVSDGRRSQLQNKVAADERLSALVREAMHVAKARRATKPTKSSKERRLSEKKRHSESKKQRRSKDFD